MNTSTALTAHANWSEALRKALADLSRAVYPPDEFSDWPGRQLEWSAAEWGVRVTNGAGTLVSYTGVLVREAEHNGQSVRIGGIGAVKTHPAARRRGYAAMGLDTALEFLHNQRDVGFALLVCEPLLLPYYTRHGWREFGGCLLIRQHGETQEFTFNRVMVFDVQTTAPGSGTIDLLGPPW